MEDEKIFSPIGYYDSIGKKHSTKNVKSNGHCHVKVDIYFSVVGMMDILDEKEIRAMMEEFKKNPQKYRYVA